jgi:hypothetical protein
MQKLVLSSLLFFSGLLSSVSIYAGDTRKPYQYWEFDKHNPASLGKELDHLPVYVKQGNHEALSQLALKMTTWKKKGCPEGYAYGTVRSNILATQHHFYTIGERDYAEFMDPLVKTLGGLVLFNMREAFYEKNGQKRHIWQMKSMPPFQDNVHCQTYADDRIADYWNYSPQLSNEILRSAKEYYYRDICPNGAEALHAIKGECEQFRQLLQHMQRAHDLKIECKQVQEQPVGGAESSTQAASQTPASSNVSTPTE